MYLDAEKTEQMLKLLEGEHFRYRRKDGAVPSGGEIDLTFGWRIELNAPGSSLTERMENDFRTFLSECMGVQFSGVSGASGIVIFALDGMEPSLPVDESFRIEAGDAFVLITAPHERGLLQASHYIERGFAMRGGPFMAKGVTERSPEFHPRIGQTVFCIANGSIDYPIMLTDKYLSLMSHFGINGIHIYLAIHDYARNTRLPELMHPKREANIRQLNNLCERAAAYGVDIYAMVITGILSADTPVFKARPEVRGALLNYSTPDDRYALCSSNPDVLEGYREGFASLFEDVPLLAGAVILAGGEGFIHCFTRPAVSLAGDTSCPHCKGMDASENVANLMNTIASGVHAANPHAPVLAWPYSAFAWSGEEDFAQEKWISLLSPDVGVISNFDTPYTFTLGKASAKLLDYNIVNLGPSEQFAEQSRSLAKMGKPHYAKFEASTEPGWFFLPYLPVPYRWAERVHRLKACNVPGFISFWRFYGFTGSISEEILCEMSWNGCTDTDDLLMGIARRDFGEASPKILEGWKILSNAWEKIPASHMIYGERAFYAKGPAYLGPAHPLIFDPQKRYWLGPKFFTIRGAAGEFFTDEELAEAEKNAPPRYSSDLLFCYPFGVNAVEEGFRKSHEEWKAGVQLIKEAMGPNPTERAKMELNICQSIGVHLRTYLNVTRFYRQRDELFNMAGTQKSFEAGMNALTNIIDDEIANAESMLPILDSDFRIGYGHCYGQVYDAGMVREKIKQCRFIRDIELPELRGGILFHVYGKYMQE